MLSRRTLYSRKHFLVQNELSVSEILHKMISYPAQGQETFRTMTVALPWVTITSVIKCTETDNGNNGEHGYHDDCASLYLF